ncbi:MAG: hypothetical protein DI538_14985 [Azospira oryzae]|nr:MAG: hypothetical protein DI538_14985 [Azospira oryzae]
MGLSIAATDGIAVLAKSDNSPVNWGFKVGVSQILKHLILCESEAGVKTYLPSDKKTHPKTTEKVVWTTFNFNWKRTPYNIFDTLALFDDITQKVKTNTWSAIISLNRYSYTTQETNRFFRRIIWSLGAGYVKVNNYDQLEERTMEQVKLPTRTNSNGTYSRQIVESTSGAIGNFIEYKGLGVYGELYYPLFKKSKERGSVFFGARASYYESGEILNAVTGLYFNLKNGKIDKSEPDNPAPDAVNFSITGQFNSIKNSRGEDNKGSKHLTAVSALVLQVAVPLRFSGK